MEEKDPANETAFMWTVDKVDKLDRACAAADTPAIYFDRMHFVLSYAKTFLEYLKKMCRKN